MKRRTLAVPLLAALLALSGCASLLERSYSAVEPYADRYWDSGAEDTLRAENSQDLVNTLLMLVEQRADEGTIRCYGEANSYSQAQAALQEVRQETMPGAYLLEDLDFLYENNAASDYCTLTYRMTYREDAEDIDGMMTLSDSQSLVDLLRMAVREGHQRLTARFSYHMPRDTVTAAVESLWRELCGDEADPGEPADALEAPHVQAPPPEEPGQAPGAEPDVGEALPQPDIPPCPWTVRFYPDMDTAELVEIWLEPA